MFRGCRVATYVSGLQGFIPTYVSGLPGCRVSNSGLGSIFRDSGFGLHSCFRGCGSEFGVIRVLEGGVLGLGFRVSGFGFRV